MGKYFSDVIVTFENLFITVIFVFKFIYALIVYKQLKKGNSKENTVTVFMFRLAYDLLIITPSLVYMQIYRDFSFWHVVNYGGPLLISELCIYFWSVRDA